jgi:hypothetical protein
MMDAGRRVGGWRPGCARNSKASKGSAPTTWFPKDGRVVSVAVEARDDGRCAAWDAVDGDRSDGGVEGSTQ